MMSDAQFAALRVGDVIWFRGRLRPIVSKSPRAVTFPILHCSWTNRVTTTYPKSEVKFAGEITGQRITKFRGELAKALIDANQPDWRHWFVCNPSRGRATR